ncbi:FABP family protein [Winkia neuii]|uniref:FABP family protein n=1 Tax=Winkia neuii TaxID=33007 RepID=UPI0004111458|nr:FABP family protein [Winkia neuii]
MFTIDADLPRNLYPLAWLVGSWRGYGSQVVPGGSDRMLIQEVEFAQDGDKLVQTAKTYSAQAKEGTIPVTATAKQGLSQLERGELEWQETATWQVISIDDPGSGPVKALVRVETSGRAQSQGEWDGLASGPRISIKLATQSGAPAKASRMFGLVNSELFWTQDVARGEGGGTDFSGRLGKVQDAD